MSYIYEIPQIDVLEQKVLYVVPGGQDNVLATDVIKDPNDARHSNVLEYVEKVQLLSDACKDCKTNFPFKRFGLLLPL